MIARPDTLSGSLACESSCSTGKPVAGALPPPGAGCNANYSGACIPNSTRDLDCGDITARNFRVVGTDVYGFDGDGNGIACES